MPVGSPCRAAAALLLLPLLEVCTQEPPVASATRPLYVAIYWAGNKKIRVQQWGAYSGWEPQETVLPPSVPVSPGTLLYAMGRSGSSGVLWATEGKLHLLYEEWPTFAEWKYKAFDVPAMTSATPLAACGRQGRLQVLWPGRGQLHGKYWSKESKWKATDFTVPLEVPISPGARIYAVCRSDDYDGVVWPDAGILHQVWQGHQAWGRWQHATTPVPGVDAGTLLAACGRSGHMKVFWAAEGHLELLQWDEEDGFRPRHRVLPLRLPVSAGVHLAANCMDMPSTDGVVWAVEGRLHWVSQSPASLPGDWVHDYWDLTGCHQQPRPASKKALLLPRYYEMCDDQIDGSRLPSAVEYGPRFSESEQQLILLLLLVGALAVLR